MKAAVHRPHTGTTVAHGFVTGMLAGMMQRNIDTGAVLSAAGIDLADSASRIPIAHYAALYNAINHVLDDEGFALFSRPLPCGTFEFLCRAVISAPTLASALERSCAFLRIVLPDLTVNLEKPAYSSQPARLHIQEYRPLADDRDAPGRVFAFEWLLRLLHGLACWLVGRGLALDQVYFPYSRPPHAEDYALIYTEKSHFVHDSSPTEAYSCRDNTLTAEFQAHLLELPVRRDELALTAFLEGAPGKLTTLYRRDREMVLRVRDLLRDALPNLPEQAVIAQRLFLSPRTLHRRLEDEGSSFRAIRDALRRDIALSRLAKSPDPIARIASDLGYADPSTFYRACIAWTGLSPMDYRRQREVGEKETG